MDTKFYNDNFERLLKEKSDEFRMYPSKRVWHSIYNDLHPGRKWPSVAVSMMLIIALFLIGYLNTNDNSSIKGLAANLLSSHEIQNNTVGNEKMQNYSATPGSDRQPEISAKDIAMLNDKNSTPGTKADNRYDENNNNNSSGNLMPVNKNNNLIESIDTYLRTNRLLIDVAVLNKMNDLKTGTTLPDVIKTSKPVYGKITVLNKVAQQNPGNQIPTGIINTNEVNKTLTANEYLAVKNNPVADKKGISQEEKAWMEDYALHNRSGRKKWKDRMTMEIYATPSIGYRNINSNVKNDALANTLTTGTGAPIDKTVDQKPSLGLEAGLGLSYSLTKSILLKGGVQLNYTNYSISADESNHPILTTLLMNDPNNGNPYLSARTSNLFNSSGLQPVTLHNKTFQFSVPVGIAFKLAGNNNLGWYIGASIQPTFVIGGTANLISSDYKNYITDASLLRRWNMNTGFETYVNYKMGGYTLQVGPQFRYQLLSTYSKKYTFNENLYSMGLKVGLVKSF